MTAKADFDVSANGTVVYATSARSGRLVIADRKGVERALDESAVFYDLAISPDGRRVAAMAFHGRRWRLRRRLVLAAARWATRLRR